MTPRFRRGGELIEEMRQAREARADRLMWIVSLAGSVLMIALLLAIG